MRDIIKNEKISEDDRYKKIQHFLDEGVDVNIKNATTKNTLLIIACSSSREKVVRLLINRGADVNAQNATGETALISATEPNIVNTLIHEGGADVNIQNDKGETADPDSSVGWLVRYRHRKDGQGCGSPRIRG